MIKHKVILVAFPFDDLSATKVRPAVCLTNPVGSHNHVLLAFITSRISAELLPTNLIIDERDSGFADTGLRVSSTLQLHRLMTINTSLIRREIGALSVTMQAQVKERLRRLFDL